MIYTVSFFHKHLDAAKADNHSVGFMDDGRALVFRNGVAQTEDEDLILYLKTSCSSHFKIEALQVSEPLSEPEVEVDISSIAADLPFDVPEGDLEEDSANPGTIEREDDVATAAVGEVVDEPDPPKKKRNKKGKSKKNKKG